MKECNKVEYESMILLYLYYIRSMYKKIGVDKYTRDQVML